MDTPIEVKGTADLGYAVDDLMRAFEAFKETNDRRLDEIERRSADTLTSEKLARIDRALDEHKRVVDELALKAVRPALTGSAVRGTATTLQHKSAFEAYVRKGEAHGLRDLEAKALSVGTDADGGYLVPDELERTVNRAVKDVSPIRAIAGIRQVSGSVYKKPFAITGAETGWVAETASRPETDAPTLAELSFPTMELYAMPAATSALLDDSAVNIDEWIAEEVRSSFATQEGTAFVTGNGTAKPKGFLDYTKVAQGSCHLRPIDVEGLEHGRREGG
jgi:HK97 family phage major capsid protein